jgi:hypothetical protein
MSRSPFPSIQMCSKTLLPPIVHEAEDLHLDGGR